MHKLKAKRLPDDMRLPANVEPYSVVRLRSLRPGQRFRFYSGSEADLENKETPMMAALLTRVFVVAWGLEERGAIRISKVKIATKNEDPTERHALFDFVAIGV
jgi:hypothetical protein